MSDQKMIFTQRSKKNEVILTIDFKLLTHRLVYLLFKFIVRPIYNFFQFISLSLNQVTRRKSYLVLSSGLGLGLGLGLMMAFFPAQIQAEIPTAVISQGLRVVRIKSPDMGIDTEVSSGKASILPLVSLEAPAIHLENSAGIGSGQTVVIQGVNQDYSLQNLAQAQLGDEIFVVGSNNGWYRYTVVETKLINLEQLHDHLYQLRETVVLYTVNSWQKTANLVIARPNH